MQINMAHLRERSTSGGDINFAVFEANARSNSESARSQALAQLTMRARASGLRVDQSALAYTENGRTKFYGDKNLVQYLANSWHPTWTHKLTV
jgi:hypothetical protein